ncbi:MAG: hypothetical protein LBP19_06750 [Treponema sp.]|jgi:hypothetical protein|nr:hypothetical protein [Treponema sp.]
MLKNMVYRLKCIRVEGFDGRKIAAYRFGKFSPEMAGRISGRTALSKKLKRRINCHAWTSMFYL